MSKNNTKNPIELSCRPDPKNKKRLICKENAVKRVDAPEVETEIEKANGGIVPTNGRPNIIIGAINIGTQPVKEYFKARWQKFYQESRPAGRFHFIIDIILVAAVVGLAIFNIFFFFQGRVANPAPTAEFKITVDATRVALGQKVRLELNYLNSDDQPLTGAKFLFKVLRGLQVVSVEGGTWDASSSLLEVGDIAKMSAGQSIVNLQTVSLGQGEIFIDFVSVDKKGRLVSQQKQGISVQVAAPELKLISQARYFSAEGEQVGRGPLPPQVGKTTKYQVYWAVENSIVDIEQVEVEAILANGVEWDDFAPLGGDIKYSPLDKKVIWKPGKVYASVDLSQEKPRTSFRIDFTPDASLLGKEGALIKDIKIKGKEVGSGVWLKGTSPDLTTNLFTDSKAVGKEKIVR